MEFIIREGTKDDHGAIMDFTHELARYEQSADMVTNSVEQMDQESHFFKCFIAETDSSEIVGMAVYFFAYYTWVGKSLYLDDLYVKEECRGCGIGSRLLKKIFEVAKSEDCKRVRWQVQNWNNPAIELYKKCKADIHNEWLNCDFGVDEIRNFNL